MKEWTNEYSILCKSGRQHMITILSITQKKSMNHEYIPAFFPFECYYDEKE